MLSWTNLTAIEMLDFHTTSTEFEKGVGIDWLRTLHPYED